MVTPIAEARPVSPVVVSFDFDALCSLTRNHASWSSALAYECLERGRIGRSKSEAKSCWRSDNITYLAGQRPATGCVCRVAFETVLSQSLGRCGHG